MLRCILEHQEKPFKGKAFWTFYPYFSVDVALESLVLTYVVIILRFSVLTSCKNTTASPEYGSLDHSLLNCNNLNTYFFE
jgi:hypothetical protein